MNRHLLQQQLIPLDLVRENKTNVEIIRLKQTMSRIPAAHTKELSVVTDIILTPEMGNSGGKPLELHFNSE
jgi:hypothetical protein